jgi:hypothetical protein
MNWYLVLNNDKQILYNAERPTFHFADKAKTPVWAVLHLEIPTRPLDNTLKWMNEKYPVNSSLVQFNDDNQIIEHWFLESAVVDYYHIRRSKVLNCEIIVLVIKYRSARKVK